MDRRRQATATYVALGTGLEISPRTSTYPSMLLLVARVGSLSYFGIRLIQRHAAMPRSALVISCMITRNKGLGSRLGMFGLFVRL